MIRRLVWIVLAAAAGLVARVSHAQDTGKAPEHDGLLLRLALGAGGAATSNRLEPELELTGGAGFFSLDLGGTLATGIALHGRLSANTMVSPSASIDGQSVGELTEVSLSYYFLGIGITYYFPSNLYLTGVAGIAEAALEVEGLEYQSETGLGLGGDIGYEWPVGGDWGLGIAGRLEFFTIPDGDDYLDSVALGVLFSATNH